MLLNCVLTVSPFVQFICSSTGISVVHHNALYGREYTYIFCTRIHTNRQTYAFERHSSVLCVSRVNVAYNESFAHVNVRRKINTKANEPTPSKKITTLRHFFFMLIVTFLPIQNFKLQRLCHGLQFHQFVASFIL